MPEKVIEGRSQYATHTATAPNPWPLLSHIRVTDPGGDPSAKPQVETQGPQAKSENPAIHLVVSWPGTLFLP